MKQSVSRFSGKEKYYDAYRPGYPSEMFEFLSSRMKLSPKDIVADIGSGTGISTQIFLNNGNKTFAVEPNDAMREFSEKLFSGMKNFFSIKGTAENTTLDDSSIDFIFCAQAFHWFNKELCRKEFIRILKPGGWVILAWNERKTSGSDFLSEYDKLLLGVSEDYEKVNHTNITLNNNKVFEDFFGINNFEKKNFSNDQVFDLEGLVGRTLSCSYIPDEYKPEFRQMMNGLKKLFENYSRDGKIKMEYDTKLFYGRMK